MYIDFAIIHTDSNDTDIKNTLGEVINLPVNSITIPYYLIKNTNSLIATNNKNIPVSCLIDYPLGISDSKTRLYAIQQAIKAGAKFVDIVIPQNLAANRKYDKIREDTKNITDICQQGEVIPRYILEYRVFDHHCLKKICEIFEENKISYVYPSTGYFLDNLADNILASIFLHQNSKDLKILCTGNSWTEKHFETMLKSGLFGYRTTSIHSLKNFVLFNSINKK